MSLRSWSGLGRAILSGACGLTVAVAAEAQETPSSTPPIRLSTPALPEAPASMPPSRLVPPPNGRLNIPEVDTDYSVPGNKPDAKRQAPPPAEAPKIVTTSWPRELSTPPSSPQMANTESVLPHLAQKQAPTPPPGGGPSPMPPNGPAAPTAPAVPTTPPPTEPPASWPGNATIFTQPPPGGSQFYLPFVPANFDWEHLTDFYGRIDGGVDREPGFPERQGIGFEVDARLRLPDAPYFSLIGELRYDAYRDHGDRITWTFGGVVEQDLLQIMFGVDGIHDLDSHTYVGSGFIMISQDLPSWHSRVGLWSVVELWHDFEKTLTFVGPLAEITTTGVKPIEQTSIFYAARLGPNCRWGEVYVAPGVDHDHGHFRLSAGYQGTIVNDLDAFIHASKAFDGSDDWSLYAGLQFHFGCGGSRPFDFVMPQRIRAREQRETSSIFVARDLLP